MLFVCLLNDLFGDFSAGVPRKIHSVSKPVVCERCRLAFAFRFPPMKILAKGYGHRSAHGGSVCLQVVPFAELERVFLQNQS